ncbi:hypothetical protein MAR_035890 [Mya arenaria]|uniref:Uncharacterized protein n=1 Tax=Mya arenaria TaxID=6604 RepID=A0ABY7ENZ3_MYAAR|nr:hypothetical protein MAR_035890 [Mya arenaria]
MAGRLYLVSTHYQREVSDARSHLKEIIHKHTFKGIDFKENKVILKCVFQDLEEVCEQQEEVTGSDDAQANDVVALLTGLNKTRREFSALLQKARNELDESDKTRREFTALLIKARNELDESEKMICLLVNQGLNPLEQLGSMPAEKHRIMANHL